MRGSYSFLLFRASCGVPPKILQIMNTGPVKTIAIIGRPNVGKSTLFNRLLGKRQAIETAIAGTTRDRLYGDIFWSGHHFEFIDVAGIEHGSKGEIAKSAQEGIRLAIENADLLLFIVDWNDKDNEIDKLIAHSLHKIDKPVILVINKADNLERMCDITEFKRLGNFPMIAISSISGKNTGDLLDLISHIINSNTETRNPKQSQNSKISQIQNISNFDIQTSTLPNESVIHLVIIGRPNVGKSTLLNTIIGQKRAITSPVPGTTRDAFDVIFNHKGKKIKITDTAGIRRRGKITKDTIESFSVLRSHRALQESDVVLIVVDGIEGIVANDVHLLGEAMELGKGAILVVNKIDLWQKTAEMKMTHEINILQKKLNFAPWLPVVFISAEENTNVKPLLNQIVNVYNNRKTAIAQADLNLILDEARNSNMQLADITSLCQKKTNPPVFEAKYKGKTKPHFSQMRYLENKIRDVYPMEGSPIFIDLSHRA